MLFFKRPPVTGRYYFSYVRENVASYYESAHRA